jgi:hypothetical protein
MLLDDCCSRIGMAARAARVHHPQMRAHDWYLVDGFIVGMNGLEDTLLAMEWRWMDMCGQGWLFDLL